MTKIAITGGKGGTGKSTVSILLANKLGKQGKNVILCDCDVECPNDFLLLGQKLSNPVSDASINLPKLNELRCQKCGICVKNCRSNAIFQPRKGFPVFFHELCSGCGLCWNICPHEAIKTGQKIIGEIFENEVAEGFSLVTGKSIGVVEETGPIVTKTKEYALKLADKIDADYLLCDTSVGMHCGVIRAIIDSDFAYAITEPTPLGAHDLKLILELLEELGVPAKVVLNQADLGKRELVEEVVKDFGLEIEFEIPYSRELVEAYSEGSLESFVIPNLIRNREGRNYPKATILK